MLHRRALLTGALAAGCAALSAGGARAAPTHAAIMPLLVDLAGFEAEKPSGMTMDAGAGPMATASRQYKRGDARLGATVMIGEAAKGALGPVYMNMNMDTPDGHMATAVIAGFKAMKVYNTGAKSGNILIALGQSSLFNLEYHGIGEDEAAALAQKFDLKALAAID